MKEKIIRSFFSIFKRSELKKNRNDIYDYNLRSVTAVTFIGLIFSCILVFLSLPFIKVLGLFVPYTFLALCFGTIAIIAYFTLKNNKKYALLFYYILMVFAMIISIYMGTVKSPNSNAMTFILFLLILPLFIIDYPIRLGLFNVIFTAIFCVADLHFKSNSKIVSMDIANAIAVCAISIVYMIYAEHNQLENFLYKRNEKEKYDSQTYLINAIPVGIAIYEVSNGDIKQIFTNDGFYRLFEDTKEERDKRTKGNFMNSIYPEDRESLGNAMREVIQGKDFMVSSCRSIKGDGSYIWVRFAAAVAKRKGDYLEVYCTYSSIEEEMRSKQATEAKTMFLSRISHDIRTPMNAIIGMNNLAKKETDLNKIYEYLDYIDNSSQFLLVLINDVLDLSKIESGEFVLNNQPCDYKEFSDDINTIIVPLMKKKNINFIFELSGKDKCFLIDKLRFGQIFFNLLSNACKFTPEGGTVEFTSEMLSSENDLQKMRFIVKDNGIGMSNEFKKDMFEPFIQDIAHIYEQKSGTGLGLPIVKSLVEAMGGTISVKSELNEGSEFVVELSLKVLDSNEQKQYNLDNNSQINISIEGMNILLAEDNDMNILVAEKVLESRGCIVTVVKDGVECINKFNNSKIDEYDAILMDVRMPRMDGIQATKEIRKLEREDSKSIAIIAMTADAFEEEQKSTIESGMNEHLSKPIEPEKLFRTLAKFKIIKENK